MRVTANFISFEVIVMQFCNPEVSIFAYAKIWQDPYDLRFDDAFSPQHTLT